MKQIRSRGLEAVDRRTRSARDALAFRAELVLALGGEESLSPQRRKLCDLIARSVLVVDHVDAWLMRQPDLIAENRLLPVILERQHVAGHLAKLLDMVGLDRQAKKLDLVEYYQEPEQQPEEPA